MVCPETRTKAEEVAAVYGIWKSNWYTAIGTPGVYDDATKMTTTGVTIAWNDNTIK